MIASEEQTRERFLGCNWQDNRDNRGHYFRGNHGGQPDRKQGPDNNLAFVEKSKKPIRFEDLLGLPCPFHKNAKHTVAECRQLKDLGFHSKDDKGKGKDNSKKDGEDQGDGGNFQHYPKGVVNVIFAGVLASTSKRRQEELTLWDIMAGEPATPKYLNWSEYPIQFSRKDQWSEYNPLLASSSAGKVPLGRPHSPF
jgi:hypothetical protein